MSPLAINIVVMAVTIPIIYCTGKLFIQTSANIGHYFKLPESVRGATIDAIASSFPELMIALFSVIAFQHFEVGIGTIAGSAMFNLLVITGVSVLVAPKVFKVSREVLFRDSLFYVVSVLLLLIALLGFKIWGAIIPLIFLVVYGFYIKKIVHDTRIYIEEVKEMFHEKVPIGEAIVTAITTMVIIGVASYFLTDHSIKFAEAVGISPIIIAFTVMAVTTSLPDGVISFLNAKKGNIDDAASNAIGSNSFDILIGIGLPAMIAVMIGGPFEVDFGHIEIVFGLLGSTLLVIYFLTGEYVLKKAHGYALLTIYAGFLGYVVWLAY